MVVQVFIKTPNNMEYTYTFYFAIIFTQEIKYITQALNLCITRNTLKSWFFIYRCNKFIFHLPILALNHRTCLIDMCNHVSKMTKG